MSNFKSNSKSTNIKYIACGLIVFFILIGLIILNNNSHKENAVPSEVQATRFNSSNSIVNTENDNNKNWNFYYDPENSWGIADIDSTENKGCVFISNVKIIENDGIQKSTKENCRFFKLDSIGNIIIEKVLPKSAFKLAYINENNYCLLTSKSIQLVDSSGEIKLEKDIELEGNFELKNIFKLNDSEFIITGKLEGNATILKLNLNLEIVRQFRFEFYSEIESIVNSNNGDLYFTGKIKNNIWYGCIDDNFNLKWQNDLVLLGKGNNIIKDRDNNFLIIGSEWATEDKLTFLLKIDKKGNTIWRKSFYGQNSEGNKNLIQLKNCFYINTFDSDGASNLYSKLYKLSFDGDILKESIPKIDGNYILMSNIINNGTDGFLSLSRAQTKGKIFIVSKLNKEAEIGKTKIEYIEEEEETLNINLNFNNDDELQRFLKIYEFYCYIKNGYFATINITPENKNNGLLTFQFQKQGEIISFRKYNYKIEKNNNRINFITNMGGEIYLESNGTLIMDDKKRNEKYIFDYREN